MATYVDAAGAVKNLINLYSPSLVGLGFPLQKGAYLREVDGVFPAVYALIEELPSRRSDDAAEDPDLLAVLSFQVYGGTREAATLGAVALAERLGALNGTPVSLPGVKIWAADDIQGPTWAPDNDLARLVVQATFRMTPA